MLNFFENLILLLVVFFSINVLVVKNPIQSILWLILTFILSCMIFMIYGVELISIIIFVVYIGAIAVLFLFIIMMLNIKIIELRYLYFNYIFIGILIICFFILEILLSIICEFNNELYNNNYYINWIMLLNFKNNLYIIGIIIYKYNIIVFILLSFILLTAMICSIVLLIDWSYENKYFYNFNNILLYLK